MTDLLTWSTSEADSKGRHIQCDDGNTFTHKGGKYNWSFICTSSSIPSQHNPFYFECELVQCRDVKVVSGVNVSQSGYIGFGFTTNNSNIKDTNPSSDLNTLGFDIFDGSIRTIQQRHTKSIENIANALDGDIFGILLKNIRLREQNYNMLQGFLNGNKIGGPLIGDSMKLYPSIWMSCPGAIIKSNLGERPFKFHGTSGSKKCAS